MKIKKRWITLGIIIFIILLAVVLIKRNANGVSPETAICISKNSELYVQLGCHACESQERLFGENYKYLNTIDCFFEGEKCTNIQYTPTWIINERIYTGVQKIKKLKELTGCE